MSRRKHLIIFSLLLAKKKFLGSIRFFEKMFYRIYSLGSYETIMPRNAF